MSKENKSSPLSSFFKEAKIKSKKKISFDDKYNYKIVISCEGEKQQRRLLKEFEKRGLKCQLLISL